MTARHGRSGLDGYITMQCLTGLPGCDDLACVCTCHTTTEYPAGPDDRITTHPPDPGRPPAVRCGLCGRRCASDRRARWIWCTSGCDWASHDPRRTVWWWRLRVWVGR